MNRTYTEREYVAGSGEPVYEITFKCQRKEEREAVRIAGVGVVVPAAFQPLPKPGEPFDAPESFGLAYADTSAHAAWQAAENAKAKRALDGLAAQAQALGMYEAPPNCDGNRQFADASAVLAHAQHEAAIDGDECTAGACLLTRGSD